MRTPAPSRRQFLLRSLQTVPFFLAAGCADKKSKESSDPGREANVDLCSDLTDVPEQDIALRRKFAYVDESPIDDNRCDNCNLYFPPKADSRCGGCMLFKGPVDPEGYCTYWAPRV